ncbi:aminoglycoside phosphotransferase family protein [Motiliproteus sp. MSK22-1]|uniref:aminoglycoside phosphotransferase family protein n=1 Tax=Motiliproteus sp. MSK22-1 TaxID=1897630 RepID=UPI0009772E14|nr:phosphotransferase [Motiliproteus sp. MSK22-1]OMH32160.1 hypothetical protein BGP75_15805 [Motiliproteus sp. MSK22-1]
MDIRLIALKDWIVRRFQQLELGLADDWQLTPLCGDASYRRYFRLVSDDNSWIVMDAPPEGGDSGSFVKIASGWRSLGITLPKVLAADVEQGFLLLNDLGNLHYLDCLDDDNADDLYNQAIDELVKIQGCQSIPEYRLPDYDREFILRELAIFPEWFIDQLLGLELSAGEQQCFIEMSGLLVDSALEQPRVCMHRDYHSRNLMLVDGGKLGIIDFQDAVLGPVSYDLVSLLRDCYIEWPQAKIERWIRLYLAKADSAGILSVALSDDLRTVDERQFLRWFDLMGMQRHLKAVGIFARLKIRDGKGGYMADIPRTLNYILQVCSNYPELEPFYQLLSERIIPRAKANAYLDTSALERLE